MRNRLLALFTVCALAVLGLGSIVIAQVPGLFIASPTGLEQIEVFVPSTGTVTTGPQKVQVTINQIRNSSGMLLVAAGTTVTTQIANTAATVLASGAITTWNVNLPVSPEDGQNVKIGCPGGNVGTLTLTATLPTGATVVGAAFTSCTAASANDAQYHYSLANNAWYRSE